MSRTGTPRDAEGHRMRLAVQDRLAPGETLAERSESCRRFGFDLLELSAPGVFEKAQQAIDERIPVSALCGGYRGWLIDPDPRQIEACVEDIARLLPMAAALDAPLIVVPIYGRSHRLPHAQTGRTLEEDRSLFLRNMSRVLDLAEQAGAIVLLEAINRYENSVSVRVRDAVELAHALGSPALKVMGDVFHMNIEEPHLGEAFASAGDLLGYVHLADSHRLEPGTGHLDFEDVFAGLRAAGYEGTLSYECHLSGPPDDVLPPSVAYIRSLMSVDANP